ncbi:MAG: PEP-CTERM sorting domain-containing protein [Verrucomicrobiota bacterium JB023]|nr:PEP-CTERM sorting domain-containing protein [Verrucomicrobiota bacterium JB023]
MNSIKSSLIARGLLPLFLGAPAAFAATTAFSYDFEAATPGNLSGTGSLGSPSVGTLNATGGFVSTGNQAYATGNNGSNNPISTANNSTFNDVGTPAGNYITASLSEPLNLAIGNPISVGFSLGSYGTNNPTQFKLVHAIGLSSTGDEVFHLTWRAGSGGSTRELYARTFGQDNTTFGASGYQSMDGTKILDNVQNGINSTNTSNRPGGMIDIDLSIDGLLWGASATPTAGTFASTPASDLAITSGASDLASIQFFSSHNSSVNNQNKGLWLDDITVTQIPEPSTALLGGMGLLALLRRRR